MRQLSEERTPTCDLAQNGSDMEEIYTESHSEDDCYDDCNEILSGESNSDNDDDDKFIASSHTETKAEDIQVSKEDFVATLSDSKCVKIPV